MILSQFSGPNAHQAYREKVRRYSEEEKRLLEKLRHGIILGTTEFVKKLRDAFLPDSPQKEIPQCRKIRKDADPSDLIHKAAAMLDVDMLFCPQSKRIPKEIKVNRDLPVFCIWKTGLLTNKKIGALFGVGYSSISHIVKSMQIKLGTDKAFMENFMKAYSLFKI